MRNGKMQEYMFSYSNSPLLHPFIIINTYKCVWSVFIYITTRGRSFIPVISICNITYVAYLSHAKKGNIKRSDLRSEIKFVPNLELA